MTTIEATTTEPKPVTFLALGTEVLAQRDRDGVRGYTRDESRWHRHVSVAAFAATEVRLVTPPMLREWLRTMADKKAMGPGADRTLSRQTISRCMSLVSVIFGEAVDRDIIVANPCLGVKQKKRVDERDTVDKWSFLTWTEQCQLAACLAIPYEDRLMIAIAANTGMRQGEMSHLEIGDVFIDGDDPHIVVRIAGRDRRDRTKKLPTKSGKKREVTLLPQALDPMREWMSILSLYAPENPEGVVFPTRAGKLRQSGKFFGRSGTLRGYYAAAGITLRQYLHQHSLRHTFATNLISGVYGRMYRTEEIRILLGHSSVLVSERYAHLGPDAIRLAARETVAAQRANAGVPAAPDTMPDLASCEESTPDTRRELCA